MTDTAAKRSSAINVTQPWRGGLPLPDGSVGAGDRQAVAFMYSGILAGVAVPVAGEAIQQLFYYERRPFRSGLSIATRRDQGARIFRFKFVQVGSSDG